MVPSKYISFLRNLMERIPRNFPGRLRFTRMALSILKDGEAFVTGDFGIKYFVPSIREPIVEGIISDGVYERSTITTILRHLSDETVFIDVGANIGAITLPVARARPRSRILAIEASPRIFELLCRNIEENNLTNITAICAFAGEIDYGHTKFFEAPDAKFGMGSAGCQLTQNIIEVSTRSLDSLLEENNLDMPSVIKIDIEGAEVFALRGAFKTLGKYPSPKVILEYNDWSEALMPGLESGAALNYLTDLGWQLSDITGKSFRYVKGQYTKSAMLIASKEIDFDFSD